MNQIPLSETVERMRIKPRLLVFDDSLEQLDSYCQILSERYDVEGVLVADCDNTYKALQPGVMKKDWDTVAKDFHTSPSAFRHVKHVVGSHQELHELLMQRKPDFVLSDYQMRRIQGPLSGIDVMHAVAELLPNTPKAIHTGSGCADPHGKVSDLNRYEFEDRMKLVKAMHEDGFRTFAKSPYHHHFDPKPIEAYFAKIVEARSVA